MFITFINLALQYFITNLKHMRLNFFHKRIFVQPGYLAKVECITKTTRIALYCTDAIKTYFYIIKSTPKPI